MTAIQNIFDTGYDADNTLFRFVDRQQGPMAYALKGSWAGWIFAWHPDGYWVSIRKASPRDKEAIARRMALGN